MVWLLECGIGSGGSWIESRLVNNASTPTMARVCCPAVTISGVWEFQPLASAPIPLPVPAAEWRLMKR